MNNIPAFSDLKAVVQKINDEIKKTQDNVVEAFNDAQDRLSALILSIENVERQLGVIAPNNAVELPSKKESEVVNQNAPGESRNWTENILKLLRERDMTTAEITEWFYKNRMIRIENKENKQRDHANIRLALFNLDHKKGFITRVEKTRGAKWTLTNSYKKISNNI